MEYGIRHLFISFCGILAATILAVFAMSWKTEASNVCFVRVALDIEPIQLQGRMNLFIQEGKVDVLPQANGKFTAIIYRKHCKE
jgi:hypothetical protein